MSVPADVAAPARPAAAVRTLLPVGAAIVLLAINLRTVIASLPPLLTAVRADLDLSAGVAGLLTTLPIVCFAVLAPVAPRLARRVSLERQLVACAAVTAVAAAVRGAGGAPALFAGSLAAGAATAIAQTVLPVLIRAAHPHRVGSLTGAYSMALTLGSTLGAGLAVPLEDAFGGSWRASLAAWGVPAALAALVWLPTAPGEGTRVDGRGSAPLRGEPLAWAVAGYFGMQAIAFYAGLAWLPTVLQDAGWSAGEAGALQAFNALVSLAPAFLVPVLAARRRGQAGLLVAIVLVAAAGVAGVWAAPGAAVLWMVLIGVGQGGALGLGLILPALRSHGAAATAALTGMTLCGGYLLASAGPWLLGTVHDATGSWGAPLAVLLALTLAALLPGLPATRPRRIGDA